jgi:hypothetical protein
VHCRAMASDRTRPLETINDARSGNKAFHAGCDVHCRPGGSVDGSAIGPAPTLTLNSRCGRVTVSNNPQSRVSFSLSRNTYRQRPHWERQSDCDFFVATEPAVSSGIV